MDQKPTSNEKGPKSAHVIDLRQKKPSTPKPPTVKPTKAPKPKKSKAVEPEVAADYVQPEQQSYVASRKRKFWPSFFRFLLLLIILGLIIAGGAFFYVTYYM